MHLDLNDIEYRRTKAKSPQTNGFMKRFNKTVLDEFFQITFRENFYESMDALQIDLNQWLICSAYFALRVKRQAFHQVTHGIAPADCSHKNVVLRYRDFTQLMFVKQSADFR